MSATSANWLQKSPLYLLAKDLVTTTQKLVFHHLSCDDWLNEFRARGKRNWEGEAERYADSHRRAVKGRPNVGEIDLALGNVVESVRRLRAFTPIRTPAVWRDEQSGNWDFIREEPVGGADTAWSVRFAALRAELNGAFETLAELLGVAAIDLDVRTKAPKEKVKGKNVNGRMMEMITNPEVYGWSARKWAEELDVSDGTVKGTEAWKFVGKFRASQIPQVDRKTKRRVGKKPL